MDRALSEFRIRGVKTNIPFLENVIHHEIFRSGQATTTLIDTTPELFHFKPRRDRATKLLNFLGNVIVNGNPHAKGYKPAKPLTPRHARRLRSQARRRRRARAICCSSSGRRNSPSGRASKSACSSPTPPSATRTSRSWPRACARYDMLARGRCRWPGARRACSRWKCGAARRSTPRCASCTKTRGNGCASCARGFRTSAFRCSFAARTPSAIPIIPTMSSPVSSSMPPPSGMDIFRIFDSLNYLPNLRVAMEAVQDTHAICEAADLLHRRHPRPAARQILAQVLRQAGQGTGKNGRAHPGDQGHGRAVPAVRRARRWSRRCKEEIGLPIHFHTHDTSGHRRRRRPAGERSGRGRRRPRLASHVRQHQPAEPEFHRRRAAAFAARHAARPGRAERIRRLLGRGARVLSRRSTPRRRPAAPKSTCTKCPAASTPI